MKAASTICSKCKSDNSEAISKGASACLVCGCWLDPDAAPVAPVSRWKLWLSFWLLFLGTPVVFLMSSGFRPALIDWAALITAVVGAGFTLSKIFTRKTWSFVVLGIVFSISVFASYVLAVYAFFYYVFSHWHGC